MSSIITPEIQGDNKVEFDRITALLQGQGSVIAKIKNELNGIRAKINSMIEIMVNYPDKISSSVKELYDVQIQALLHAMYMYLSQSDSSGTPFISPYSSTAKYTDIVMTLKFPHYTKTFTLISIDNITIDIYNWNVYAGDQIINILKVAELASQQSVISESPEQYFSKEEFYAGVKCEIEKIILFASQINRIEQMINASLRYISELRNLGLSS